MNKRDNISIIDYGIGNLRSLIRAFEYFGSDVTITENAQDISESKAIVLPGDGAFAAGMKGLAIRNLTNAVIQCAKDNKPILGICLGAQILVSQGFEFGKHKGLSLMDGDVIKFAKDNGEKIPQIGWNSIYKTEAEDWKGTVLEGVKSGSHVYFIHSYITLPKKPKNILSLTRYGKQEFSSVIYKENIYGCQFHPEKSGAVGLKIIENFIKITNKNI